jgi:hypothetical protein
MILARIAGRQHGVRALDPCTLRPCHALPVPSSSPWPYLCTSAAVLQCCCIRHKRGLAQAPSWTWLVPRPDKLSAVLGLWGSAVENTVQRSPAQYSTVKNKNRCPLRRDTSLAANRTPAARRHRVCIVFRSARSNVCQSRDLVEMGWNRRGR